MVLKFNIIDQHSNSGIDDYQIQFNTREEAIEHVKYLGKKSCKEENAFGYTDFVLIHDDGYEEELGMYFDSEVLDNNNYEE